MKQKALTNCSNLKDNDLVNYAQSIFNKLTANSSFSSPQPTLQVLQGFITAYSTALVKAIDGNKADTANKNATRLSLESALSMLDNYVNLTANYDLVKLESSGFTISKLPESVGILDAPNLKIDYGNNPGEVNYEITSTPNASGYIILYTPLPAPADNSLWRSKTVSAAKGTITNLPHETKLIFKATATSSEANKMGQYNFSNPVERLVP